MKYLLFATLLISLGATCNNNVPAADNSFQLDTVFELQPGETRTLKDTDFSLTFDRIGEDSRCPEGVTCVWAGQVVAQMTSSSGPLVMTMTGKEPIAQTVNGYRVELLEVNPYPKNEEGTPAAESYRLQLKVTK